MLQWQLRQPCKDVWVKADQVCLDNWAKAEAIMSQIRWPGSNVLICESALKQPCLDSSAISETKPFQRFRDKRNSPLIILQCQLKQIFGKSQVEDTEFSLNYLENWTYTGTITDHMNTRKIFFSHEHDFLYNSIRTVFILCYPSLCVEERDVFAV